MTSVDTKTSPLDLSGEQVDQRFFELMEQLADLDSGSVRSDQAMLEQQRDQLLEELLLSRPNEAVSEVVLSLFNVYQNRAVQSIETGGVQVTEFATRNQANVRLDDHYVIIRNPNGDVMSIVGEFTYDTSASGYRVSVSDENVRVDVLNGPYATAMNPDGTPSSDGYNNYTRTLREFYVRALTTAGLVRRRQERNPLVAAENDRQARNMLTQEYEKASQV